MDSNLRKQIDELKPEAIKNAKAIAGADKMVHVNGTRYKLPLEGRTINMVYYKTEKENAPLIIGYHGGGFLYGGCALDDDLWCAVRDTLKVNIASIGYRQSPDYKWDVCLADCCDAAVYLKEHSSEYGFDGENISVMGQSAGGNLAAAVSLKMGQTREVNLRNEIMVYPFLDVYTDPYEKGDGSFSGLLPIVMNELHCSQEEALDPLCSPIYATDEMIKALPNTICAVSEDDNLRPEAVKYCERLKSLGVSTHLMLAKGMPHGYIENGFRKKFRESDMEFLGKNGEQIVKDGSLRRVSEETLSFIKENLV